MSRRQTIVGLCVLAAILAAVLGGVLIGRPAEKTAINPSPAASSPPSPSGLPIPSQSATTAPGRGGAGAPSAQPAPAPTPVSAVEISRGNQNKREVIFTFDCGAGSQSLAAILNTLAAYHVKGTFFMTGKWAEANPSAARQISAAGHEVFNHTYDHPYLTQVSDAGIIQELGQADAVISPLIGRSTKPFFRPPYGDRNAQVLQVAAAQGYRSVYWTVDALDWKEPDGYTAAQSESRILSTLGPGNIYLMHVGDNITGQILADVFAKLTSQGYGIVSLTQGL